MSVVPSPGAKQLGDFLARRRARLRPQDLGLPAYGPRRVPGLRREEVAEMAGVSSSYYTRIEQGQVGTASTAIVDSLARVLRLNEDERAYVHRLAAPRPRPSRAPYEAEPATAPRSLQELTLSVAVPALVIGRALDVLAWNRPAASLFDPALCGDAPADAASRPNWARLIFLDRPFGRMFVDWERGAAQVTGYLRYQSVHHPDDRRLWQVIDELLAEAQEFGRLWARHEVCQQHASLVSIQHPTAGHLTLTQEALHSPHASGSSVMLFHAAPGSEDADALDRIARAS